MLGARRTTAAIAAAILLLAVAAVLIVTRGDDDDPMLFGDLPVAPGAAGAAAECDEVDPPPARQVELEPPGPDERLARDAEVSAVVETNCGTFEIALATDEAPLTTSSFAHLARNGVYDGTRIHRIEPMFVFQGGDPTGEGTGGAGYSVDEEPPEGFVYERGVVAMAKTPAEPPGRSSSQFFVVTAPADAGLPADYAVVGQVSQNEDVMERIGTLGGADGQPTFTVVIRSVTIRER